GIGCMAVPRSGGSVMDPGAGYGAPGSCRGSPTLPRGGAWAPASGVRDVGVPDPLHGREGEAGRLAVASAHAVQPVGVDGSGLPEPGDVVRRPLEAEHV